MKFFVSGSDGYIGTVLCELLIRDGHSVLAFDRCFFGRKNKPDTANHTNFSRQFGDIRQVTEHDLSGVDVVIDLAALSNDPSSELNEDWTRQINFVGRTNLALAAKRAGVKRYIFASSCSVYGAQKDDVVSETSDCKPVSLYAETCLRAEEQCLSWSESDFQVTSLRQATVFGRSYRMRFDLMINLMTLSAFKQRCVFVMGGGEQWRPLVHVRDTASALKAFGSDITGQHAGEIYNIGVDNLKVIEAAYRVSDAMPFEVEIKVVPEDADNRSYRVSFNKLVERGAFVPSTSIASGIDEVFSALRRGEISEDLDTKTVSWYQHLIEMNSLLNEMKLDDKLLSLD